MNIYISVIFVFFVLLTLFLCLLNLLQMTIKLSVQFTQPAIYSENYGIITPVPILNTTGRNHRNITLAVTLGARTGNVLFQLGSAIAIAAHYNLNLCINRRSESYQIVLDMAPLLNIVFVTCPKPVQKSLDLGNKVNLYNHCCVFEDFYVTHGKFSKSKSLSMGKMMSLTKLFGQQQEKIGDLFDLYGFRQSWKYLTIGPKITELRLKKKVVDDARKKLESLGHVHKRVAIHLRVTDASRMDMYN